jgi:hypothetical protein
MPCLALCAPVLVGNLIYLSVLLYRGEFIDHPGMLLLYVLQRMVGDCAALLLIATLLFRLAPRWLALYVWPLAYGAFGWIDATLYYFSLTVLDVYHFELIAWPFIARFVAPLLVGAGLLLVSTSLVYGLIIRRLGRRLSFYRLAAAALCIGGLAAINLPWWLQERPNLRANCVDSLAAQARSLRLAELTRLPVGLLSAALRRAPWHVRGVDALESSFATRVRHDLPLGPRTQKALPLKPLRTIVLITTESLSLDLLGGFNSQLPAALAPFYNDPAIRPHVHLQYFTSAAPTRQGIMSSLTSHPNAALMLDVGFGQSVVWQLKSMGFDATFIKGDAHDYSPEAHVLTQLGFDRVVAREQLSQRPDCRSRMDSAAVADDCVYRALLDELTRQGPGKHFYQLLGVDTHPGKRSSYLDLSYPEPSVSLPPGEAGATLRAAAWHDLDMQRLWRALKQHPAFGDDFLLILTADHCRPLTPELAEVPGYPQDALCRIPLAFLSPQRLPAMTDRVGSQIDLAPSLMHLLGGAMLPGWWGSSVFDPDKHNPAVGMLQRSLVVRETASDRQLIYLDHPSEDEGGLVELVDTLYVDRVVP